MSKAARVREQNARAKIEAQRAAARRADTRRRALIAGGCMSSPTDVYSSTPTLSFYGSRYTSRYLAFVPVEWYGEKTDPRTPFGHVYLEHPTTQQAALFARYAGGSVPFVDIGNRYVVPQAQYTPSALAGMSWAQVAAAMRNPASPVGRDIDGAANMIAAAICKLTHGQPRNVCTSPGVAAAEGSL